MSKFIRNLYLKYCSDKDYKISYYSTEWIFFLLLRFKILNLVYILESNYV